DWSSDVCSSDLTGLCRSQQKRTRQFKKLQQSAVGGFNISVTMESTFATDKPESFRRTKRACVSVEVCSIVAYFCLNTVICCWRSADGLVLSRLYTAAHPNTGIA